MFEQAKIASLQENIKDTRSNARTYFILTIISIALAIGGSVLYLSPYPFGQGYFIYGVIIGVILPNFRLGVSGNNGIKKRLMMEPDNMSSKIPSCPHCDKPIPQGNDEFCPSVEIH